MKKSRKVKITILSILFILQFLATGYMIYSLSLLSGIETVIRILVSISIILIMIILSLTYLKSIKKKKSKYYIYVPFVIIYIVILLLFGYYIHKTYAALHKLSTNSITYSSSLVALSSDKATSLKNLGSGKIGMVDDETNTIGYTIPNDIIKSEKISNKVESYESYVDIINALYNNEIEYAFLPTNYTVMFETMEEANFTDIRDKTKIIYTKNESVKSSDKSKGTSLTKPFTILLMGVDSEEENIKTSSFNGDSLILITFNPTTLSTTFLSIPRDSYVPITCFAGQKKNKITHAAWYGEECMMDTITNFTGIDIDYFVKINFKGVVKMVDTLGGVEVDVPYSFCEQDSNRKFGNNTIYVKAGLQTLYGEQALAFARNRHTWPEYCGIEWSNYVSNDFIRGQNQQTIIRALLNKIGDVKSLDTVYNLLDVIGDSMETNMTTSEILSFYNIAKDILTRGNGRDMDDLLSIQRLYLSGYDKYIYDPGTKLNLYNYVLYDGSIKDISEAMKINLGKQDPTLVKSFSFSIDEEYEEEVIGKGTYTISSTDVGVIPDFVGDSEAQARKTANRLGIKLAFKYTETENGNNTVIYQSHSEGTSISKVGTLTLTIATKKESTSDSKNNTTSDKSESTTDKNNSSVSNNNKKDNSTVSNNNKKDNSTSSNTNANTSVSEKKDETDDNTSDKNTSSDDSSSETEIDSNIEKIT